MFGFTVKTESKSPSLHVDDSMWTLITADNLDNTDSDPITHADVMPKFGIHMDVGSKALRFVKIDRNMPVW